MKNLLLLSLLFPVVLFGALRFDVQLLHKDNIESIINRIDYVASNYKIDSEIAKINNTFKEYQFISKDLFNILKIAKEVEINSNGFYNIMLGKISGELGFSPTFNKNLIQSIDNFIKSLN